MAKKVGATELANGQTICALAARRLAAVVSRGRRLPIIPISNAKWSTGRW